MNSPVPFPGFGPLLAVLLVTGHALADFALQTRGMVRNKHRFPGLAAHIGVVFVVQAALLLPVLSLRMLVVVAGITVAHGIIDRTNLAARSCDHRVVATKLAVEFYASCGKIDVLPIGVNTDLFTPMDKKSCRAEILPEVSIDEKVGFDQTIGALRSIVEEQRSV